MDGKCIMKYIFNINIKIKQSILNYIYIYFIFIPFFKKN